MPRPSQPSRINIRFGIKISINIDKIKRITKMVNRGRKGSVCIYEVENRRTFIEINKMAEANSRAGGSNSRVKLICRVERERRFHSRIEVEVEKERYKVSRNVGPKERKRIRGVI